MHIRHRISFSHYRSSEHLCSHHCKNCPTSQLYSHHIWFLKNFDQFLSKRQPAPSSRVASSSYSIRLYTFGYYSIYIFIGCNILFGWMILYLNVVRHIRTSFSWFIFCDLLVFIWCAGLRQRMKLNFPSPPPPHTNPHYYLL